MARQEVTFEQVAEVAAGLQQDGAAVTLETVRAALGESPGEVSASALSRHLAQWRAAHAAPLEPPKAELPPALLGELAKWAQQYAQDAGAATRAALDDAASDLELLRAAGEAQEEQLDSLTLARDQAEARVAERDETIERLSAELSDARRVAMDSLVSKAKDQLAIEGKESQLTALRAQIERNVAAQAAESDARLGAEMELVGATTARDGFASEARELRTQLEAVRAERSAMKAELEALRAKR